MNNTAKEITRFRGDGTAYRAAQALLLPQAHVINVRQLRRKLGLTPEVRGEMKRRIEYFMRD